MAPRKKKPSRKSAVKARHPLTSAKKPAAKKATKKALKKTAPARTVRKAAAPKRTDKPVTLLRPRKSLAHRKRVAEPRQAARSHAPKSAYDRDLDRNPANYQPLSPLNFLERAARFSPSIPQSSTATVTQTMRNFSPAPGAWPRRSAAKESKRATRSRRCCPTRRRCWKRHYGVPMTGAVLNTLNTRLDAAAIAFMLEHGEAKMLVTDREFSTAIHEALALVKASRW